MSKRSDSVKPERVVLQPERCGISQSLEMIKGYWLMWTSGWRPKHNEHTEKEKQVTALLRGFRTCDASNKHWTKYYLRQSLWHETTARVHIWVDIFGARCVTSRGSHDLVMSRSQDPNMETSHPTNVCVTNLADATPCHLMKSNEV